MFVYWKISKHEEILYKLYHDFLINLYFRPSYFQLIILPIYYSHYQQNTRVLYNNFLPIDSVCNMHKEAGVLAHRIPCTRLATGLTFAHHYSLLWGAWPISDKIRMENAYHLPMWGAFNENIWYIHIFPIIENTYTQTSEIIVYPIDGNACWLCVALRISTPTNTRTHTHVEQVLSVCVYAFLYYIIFLATSCLIALDRVRAELSLA